MITTIAGNSAFAYLHIDLEPGEQVMAESDAMASMSAELDLRARFNGGLGRGLLRKYFGKESLFINEFTNHTQQKLRLTLTQTLPGEIRALPLNGGTFCLQPGAYIASTPEIKLGVTWAGIVSWLAGEGLFKLVVSGHGTVWYGAYGGMFEKSVDGEYIVDSEYLVGYEPQLKLKLRLAGGLFASWFGGEGLVTRVIGEGKIVIQTRSLEGLMKWLKRGQYGS